MNGILAWCIYNMTTIGCFTALAIHFDKWWIVLLSAIFLFSYKNGEK